MTGAISATLSVNFLESVIKGVRFAADSALEGESGARSATSISGRSVTRIITRRSFGPVSRPDGYEALGGRRAHRVRTLLSGGVRGPASGSPAVACITATASDKISWDLAQLPAELTEERAWHDRQRDYRPEGRVATRRPQASRRRGLAMRRRPTHCNAPPFPHMRRQGCNRAAPYGHSTRLESDRSS